MEVLIRAALRKDIESISSLWLEALEEADLDGQVMHSDAAGRLNAWLVDRLRERPALGLVGEVDGAFAGFLLGRVGEWDASPPILRPRRLGLIDVVCVVADLRNRGIGTRLVADALEKMQRRGVVRVETSYQVADVPASRMWAGMDFRPTLQRASRPLDRSGP